MDRPSARFVSLLAALTLVCVILGGTRFGMTRSEVQFFEMDPGLSRYPMSEQVTNFMCIALNLTIFAVILVTMVIFTPVSGKLENYLWKKSQWDASLLKSVTLMLWHALGAALATLSAQAIVGVLKNLAGRPRPNAYFMCNYQGYREAVYGLMDEYLRVVKPSVIGDIDNCFDKEHTNEAFLSFPSGHASLSFAFMVYCCYLLRIILGVRSGVYFSELAVLAYTPLVFALWVSITRVQDGWHHEDDISVGAAIGALCAGGSICTISSYIAMDSIRMSNNNSPNYSEENSENDEDPLLPL